MTMRAPLADLPVVLANATVVAGAVTILDGVSLSLDAGTPTVLIGIVIIINALAWMLRRAGERMAG